MELDIGPLQVDWTRLVALHRTEHEEEEEEDATALEVRAQLAKASVPDVHVRVHTCGVMRDALGIALTLRYMRPPVQVTVNSGGIVYFALFNISQDPSHPKMAAACLKFAPSRLATQSEKLGSELARHLHVATPQVGSECRCGRGGLQDGESMEQFKR